MGWWEEAYRDSPPWDIGAPQPEIVRLVDDNEIKGEKLLDIGCGLADNAIFLAERGFSVTCMDIAHLAIEKGKIKAGKLEGKIDFLVGDVLRLDEYFKQAYFDTVIDSGLFHTLGDRERYILAAQIRQVLVDGGKYFMMCFSDKEPGNEGPRRLSKKEIMETFSNMFRIDYIRNAYFASKYHRKGARAFLASMTKTVY